MLGWVGKGRWPVKGDPPVPGLQRGHERASGEEKVPGLMASPARGQFHPGDTPPDVKAPKASTVSPTPAGSRQSHSRGRVRWIFMAWSREPRSSSCESLPSSPSPPSLCCWGWRAPRAGVAEPRDPGWVLQETRRAQSLGATVPLGAQENVPIFFKVRRNLDSSAKRCPHVVWSPQWREALIRVCGRGSTDDGRLGPTKAEAWLWPSPSEPRFPHM